MNPPMTEPSHHHHPTLSKLGNLTSRRGAVRLRVLFIVPPQLATFTDRILVRPQRGNGLQQLGRKQVSGVSSASISDLAAEHSNRGTHSSLLPISYQQQRATTHSSPKNDGVWRHGPKQGPGFSCASLSPLSAEHANPGTYPSPSSRGKSATFTDGIASHPQTGNGLRRLAIPGVSFDPVLCLDAEQPKSAA